jgi:hypothetical protein
LSTVEAEEDDDKCLQLLIEAVLRDAPRPCQEPGDNTAGVFTKTTAVIFTKSTAGMFTKSTAPMFTESAAGMFTQNTAVR